MGEVDYLAAAVGRDRRTKVGRGVAGERVVGESPLCWEYWGNPPCAGSTGGIPLVLGVLGAKLCVCLDHLVTGVHAPHTCSPLFIHTATPQLPN